MYCTCRYYVISQLPRLLALDDTMVGDQERDKAIKLYGLPRRRSFMSNGKLERKVPVSGSRVCKIRFLTFLLLTVTISLGFFAVMTLCLYPFLVNWEEVRSKLAFLVTKNLLDEFGISWDQNHGFKNNPLPMSPRRSEAVGLIPTD